MVHQVAAHELSEYMLLNVPDINKILLKQSGNLVNKNGLRCLMSPLFGGVCVYSPLFSNIVALGVLCGRQ